MRFDKRLLALTGSMRGYIAVTSLIGVLVGILAIAQALALSNAVNGVFIERQTLDGIGGWVLLLLGAIVGRAALLWISEVVASRAAARAKRNLREPLLAHILRLGPAYTRGERSGELSNLATEGVESLDAYFSQYLPQLFITAFVPLLVGVAVFMTDTLSGIVLLITAPLLPVFLALVGIMAAAASKRQWRQMSFLSAHFLDVLQGLTTLKLFGRGAAQRDNIRRISEQYRDTTMGVLRVAFLSSLVLELGATVSMAIIAVQVGLRVVYGQMEFAPAFLVLLLAPEFFAPFRALGTRFHAAMSGGTAAARILDVLQEGAANVPAPADIETPVVPLALEKISFHDVRYSYPAATESGQEEQPALQGISFDIEPGHKVALVGPSGAGKSTLAQLLLRFIEPSGGTIAAGGVPLAQIDAREWRKLIAWVPQRPYLFHGTVAENILLSNPDASKEEVSAAAQSAHADEFIMALPQGYDTIVGEHGARLSGGQAQRIGLARAFLRNAPILLLDEPTANLDPETERLIIDSTRRLMHERTVLIIAHRLGTVIDADKVVVLDAGRVVEQGSHRDLLREPGVYRQLVSAYGGAGVQI